MAGSKKAGKYVLLIILLIGAFFLFKFIGPATQKPATDFLFVKTGTTMKQLKEQLVREKILPGVTWFNYTSKMIKFIIVKPGKYKITNGMSVLNLVRMLRNGNQTPVNFVVKKIRTKESLAGKIGHDFECDSITVIQFLNSADSLRDYELDSNTVMAAVLPLTYNIKWNTTPRVIFDKFYDAYKKFWTEARKQKAVNQGLTVTEAITLASIVDEETNAAVDKPKIASAYMNRVAKGMPLQADPTIKFALKDFSIKRILFGQLKAPSPYNTYQNKGWPPGPICTPQTSTIDSVLNAPKTDYIYFVADSTFNGAHVFSTNYLEHMKYAKAYQRALDIQIQKRDSIQATE